MGKYLLLDYCHPVWHKLGVTETLNYWALMVLSRDEGKEKSYIRKCLKRCGYPGWAFLKSTKKNKPERAERENLIIISVITGTSEKHRNEEASVTCLQSKASPVEFFSAKSTNKELRPVGL